MGTPESPKSDTHVQAQVAEVIWHILTREEAGVSRELVHAEGPKFYVTEPGGDGLAVWQEAEGGLAFRLWEVKKHHGSSPLSRTLSSAYSQLSTRGAQYLAQYTALGIGYEGALADLYAHLVDSWIDAQPHAGAGVSVSTSEGHSPQGGCFLSIRNHFPEMTNPGQLEGMIVAIGDFPAFAEQVRGILWTGL